MKGGMWKWLAEPERTFGVEWGLFCVNLETQSDAQEKQNKIKEETIKGTIGKISHD